MSASGANPFLCEAIHDGDRCNKPSTWVYKSALAPAALMCDECAAELKATSRGMRKVPVMEFSLLELIPAREALLASLEYNDKALAQALETSRGLSVMLKQSRRTEWVTAAVLVLVGGIGIWGWFR